MEVKLPKCYLKRTRAREPKLEPSHYPIVFTFAFCVEMITATGNECNSFFCPSESLPPTSLNHSSDFTCAAAAAVCRPSRRVGEFDIPWQHLPRPSGAAAGRRIDRERAGERNSRKLSLILRASYAALFLLMQGMLAH